MSLESPLQQKIQKIGAVNALRFLAAFFVIMYHFTFVYFYRDLTYVNIPFLRPLFQYGYLGVDLFFIISGFVISLSAENRKAYGFLKSRIGRLYPIFWISALISSLFLLFGGELIYSTMSWSRFLLNMTMFPSFFNTEPLDGTYWTLVIEMKFYAIILFLLLCKQFKRIEILSIFSALLILFTALYIPNLQVDSHWTWVPNFIAGIIFYKIYKNGHTLQRSITLGITFITSCIFTLRRIPYLSEGYNLPFNSVTICLYIFSFYVLFILIASNKIYFPNNTFINTLGLLTYPLYLLHQQIGRILFTYSDIKNIPLWISFTSILFFIFILSYFVHKVFEKRGKIILDTILDRIIPSSLTRL